MPYSPLSAGPTARGQPTALKGKSGGSGYLRQSNGNGALGGSSVSLKRVQQTLKHLATIGDLPLVKGAAMHAIRRGLIVAWDTAGVSDAATGHFIRWKQKQGPNPNLYREKHRYSHPTQPVGITATAPAAETVHLIPASRTEDQAVWDAHPFLADWTPK